MKQLKHDSYCDGILEYGEIKSIFSSNRKKIGEDFISKGKLFFTLMSVRDGDLIQANNLGYVIDMKVKSPLIKNISSKDKVKINKKIYDIEKLDFDTQNVYLYLQRVGV
ncbi:phage head closure protein [Senegalia massiliensis]|uniref:phage head closure protein n=1 Tax=Senegalia massiliensis TaxID=1720316 RepID=UPI00102F9A13|nr:phage head closure protein [Senegalia massiliensis]